MIDWVLNIISLFCEAFHHLSIFEMIAVFGLFLVAIIGIPIVASRTWPNYRRG